MLSLVAAISFAVLLAALAAFQIALLAGAPLGRLAWGGKDRVLPRAKRIGSAVAIVLYAGFAVLALVRAGAIGDVGDALPVVIAMWVVFGYLVLGIGLNALSRSPQERYVMTPVALLLAILAFVVALGR